MIKAAFFDIDGTLMSHRSKGVPQSARMALEKLRAKGVACIVATGRQITEYEKLPCADIPFDGYITLNGQMVLDENKELLFATQVTGKAKEYLVRAFEEHLFPAMMVERDRVYVNFADDLVRQVHDSLSTPVPPLGVYRGREIYQVCVYMHDDRLWMLDPIADACTITRWHFGGYDVIASGGGKVRGIRQFLEMKGIAPEEVIAFGDGENDEEMLRFAGIGVAMGNGAACTKEAADYVTADIDDDGIEKALKHFALI